MNLSEIWNGDRHLLEPGEWFPEGGATHNIIGFEQEDEEEDVLSPFETPTMQVVLQDTRSLPEDPRFPNRALEQAWGALSVNLTAMSYVLGITKKQFQEVNHRDNTMAWTFQTDEFFTERL